MTEKIILLGYMGSGKSAIGKHIASILSLPFYDLDTFIEQKEEKKISEIFSEKGEIYFRHKEQEYLQELLLSPSQIVLSLGGGTPCYGNAMKLINKATPYVFYLQLPAKVLMQRLSVYQKERPLIAHLSKGKLEEFINKHLFERYSFYTQASFIIPCEGLSITGIADKMLERIK